MKNKNRAEQHQGGGGATIRGTRKRRRLVVALSQGYLQLCIVAAVSLLVTSHSITSTTAFTATVKWNRHSTRTLRSNSLAATVNVNGNTSGGSTSSTGSVPSTTGSSVVTGSTTLPRKLEFNEEEHEENADTVKSGWLNWMVYGSKPRGTNKVIMREAEELGGVPRSDRYSSKDWFHNTVTLPNSAILRDIRSPVLAATGWSTFLSIVHEVLLRKYGPAAASFLHFPSAPHSLMMSALGLLLVFRTNSAYQRFAEGRIIWERIINTSRDFYRMIMLYETEIGLDRRRRLQRLLAAFPYLLRHRIRPNLVMRRLGDDQYERDPENTILLYQDTGTTDDDPDAAVVARAEEETGTSRRKARPLFWVDKRTLPWRLLPSNALEPCARAQNRPLWVCDRMAQEIRGVPGGLNFTPRESLVLLSHINKLSACIGGAERIHQTVVPLNYARHTLRGLTLWLFTLPLAVVKELRLVTGPTIFLVAWLLFGVYEIGYAIEDPFQGSLRLSILCDTIRRDVLGDELHRSSAFEIEDDTVQGQQQPSSVSATGVKDYDEIEGDADYVAPTAAAAITETVAVEGRSPKKESDEDEDGEATISSLPKPGISQEEPDAYQ